MALRNCFRAGLSVCDPFHWLKVPSSASSQNADQADLKQGSPQLWQEDTGHR